LSVTQQSEQVLPFPRGAAFCDWLVHDEGIKGWQKRWCVLAGNQLDVYERYGVSQPMQTILLGQNAKKDVQPYPPRKTSVVKTWEFPSGGVDGSSHNSSVLEVVDVEGNEW
jgi:hypothetical protein